MIEWLTATSNLPNSAIVFLFISIVILAILVAVMYRDIARLNK